MSLVISIGLSAVAYFATLKSIPYCTPLFIQSGLHGKDLLKPKAPLVVESMGVIVGVVYFVAMFLFIPFPFLDWFGRHEASHPFPHDKVIYQNNAVGPVFGWFTIFTLDVLLRIRR